MKIQNFLLVAIALFSLGAFASASYSGLTLHWGPGDVYFEIYRGDSYYYTSSPYYYYGYDYYYFPNNFRYYYNTQWYYQNSGWFYYNGYDWYRDNAWVFYDNYWYYPRYNYYYYAPFFEPTIIQVQQLDTPYCSDIDIATHTINVKEGQITYDTFWIDNKSNDVFEISRIVVLENDSEIDVQPYWGDDFAPEQGSAELTIRTQADSGIESKLTTAYVQVEGVFADAEKRCNFSDTSESFTVNVKGIETESSSDSSSQTDYSTSSASSASFSSDSSASTTYNYNITDSYNTTNYYDQTTNSSTSSTSTQSSALSLEPKTSCSSIQTFTKNFALGSDDSKTQNFIVKNDSDKAFYIESIQAFDDSPNFVTKALSASKTSINAHGSITIPVKIESFEVADNVQESATFKISGSFEDNSYCSGDAIGGNDFGVQIIAPEPEMPSAADFQINVPDTVQVPASGASFTIAFTNNTGKSGFIKAYSPDAIVSPQAINIPANGTASTVITVIGLDENSAWVFYDVFIPNLNINSRVTKIVKVQATPTPTPIPQPTPQPQPQNPQVSIDSTATSNSDGSYDINVVVTNENNYPISGDVEIEVPDDWSVSGDSFISLKPLEQKTISLKAKPKTYNGEDLQTTIQFKSTAGFNFSEPILLKANSPALIVAFAILGANAFLIGILVIILIVLLAVYIAGKTHQEKTIAVKDQWATAAK